MDSIATLQIKSITQIQENRATDDISSPETVHENECETDNESTEKNVQTFRYKFTSRVMLNITNFAKLHQHDDRATYKESWEEWCEENYEMIQEEEERLQNLGYDKDVVEKMYKAGRYYFRKKSSTPAEPKKRRIYTALSTSMLDEMDKHIVESMDNIEFTPASGYSEFCEKYQETIVEEIKKFLKTGILDADSISAKIKKTYKNRYYIISRSK